jgi:hypothetical protein
MDIAVSKNNIGIRLTPERWTHISEEHNELSGYYHEVLEAVQYPAEIFEGKNGELIAVKEIDNGKYLLVVYKELNNNDGFIITAFFSKQITKIRKRERIWQKMI